MRVSVLKKVKHRVVETMSSGTADALGLSRAILCNGKLPVLPFMWFIVGTNIDITRSSYPCTGSFKFVSTKQLKLT